MRPPPFILVRKSDAPKRPEKGLLGGVLPLNFHVGVLLQSAYPVCFPTPLLKAAHRAHTTATGAFLWATAVSSGVGAGHARKCARLPLAASQVLCLPHPRVGKLVSHEMAAGQKGRLPVQSNSIAAFQLIHKSLDIGPKDVFFSIDDVEIPLSSILRKQKGQHPLLIHKVPGSAF